MRVLHLYRTYLPDTQGGLEETIRQICLSTSAHGVESRVLFPSRSPDPETIRRPEATVFRTKLNFELASCSVSLDALRQFPRHAQWADIIHYHFPWPYADILHALTAPAKPTMMTYHSDIVRQRLLKIVYTPLMNRFLRSVDQIVCTSPNYLATSDVLQKYRDKVEVVPIGLDEDSYGSPDRKTLDLVRSRYGEGYFLFVGVLRYYKGLHILLDAAKDAPYRIVIVGAGPIEQELKAQARRLNLHNVSFAGHVPDSEKPALFALSRGVVFPSYLRSEAFGVTLLEGAMYGRPLISAEVGSGTSHVNKHHETGLIVEPGSAPALRAAMDELHDDQVRAEEMGRRARARYERLFTGEIMGRNYAGLYERLLTLTPSARLDAVALQPVDDD